MEGIPDHHEAPDFHESTSTVVSVVFASSDPLLPFQKKDERP
jgi:hypothetical protein